MLLSNQRCKPCRGGVPPLERGDFEPWLSQIPLWQVADGERRLLRTIKTDNFMQSLELANRIALLAEDQNHHPDLLVRWGELKMEIFTHSIDGLTESDFILAAKIDQLLAQ